ncbi:MAG: hypothetical protein HYU28_03270 [Actinobacteria bacterium]|nr:hypothetical protein [Actinomycetota bacterium]
MHPYVRSGLMAVAVASAIGLVVAGFLAAESDEVTLPDAIQRIIPTDGALIAPQGNVGVDLSDDHTGVLMIDGREIPGFQATSVESLGQVFFSPGPGKEIREFRAGTHRITVVYWDKAKTRDDGASFSWTFRVG